MPTRLHLFGPPALQQGLRRLAFAPERRFRLLAVLAVAGDWVTRDRLAALFWPDRDHAAARANLRKLLMELRQLALSGVEDGPAGLRWRVDSDLAVFLAAVERADWRAAAEQAQGRLLQGLDTGNSSAAFDAWLTYERAELQRRWRSGALQALATGALAAADIDALCSRLLAADPMDESVLTAWLQAARAAGAAAAAEAACRRYTRQLAEELGLEPSERLRSLAVQPARPTPPTLPGSAAAAAESVSAGLMAEASPGPDAPALLQPAAPLLGRGADQTQAAQRLAGGARLLTLLGPGGVGKTLLARHLALALAPRYRAVWFVALEDLATPSALPGRIAERLDPRIALQDDGLELLARHWPAGPTLLVLDGFEHLVDAVGWVERLLLRLPALQVVVTSRERLEAEGEWLLPLAGLGAPAADASREVVLQHEAVQLFAERARRVAPAFSLLDDWAAVRAICAATEGLPLALELAAAWLRVLPCARIAHDLDASMALLAGGNGAGTMQAVFDHSWALLTPVERQAFAKLAVFRGGFTREAAQQVADIGLPVLANLVDKSMLRVDEAGRFHRHALLHEGARAKLQAQPAVAAEMQLRHGRWCLAHLLRHHGVHGGGHGSKRAAIAAERDNVLQAWQGWVQRRELLALDAAVEVVSWFHVVEGRLPDAIALFDTAAQALGEGTASGALLRSHQAWLELWMDRYEAAEAMARQALARLQAARHGAGTRLALRTLAHAARRLGRHAESSRLLGRALRLLQHGGDAGERAVLLDARAMALVMLGRQRRAATLVRLAMRLNHLVGNEAQLMYNEFNLSQALGFDGHTDAALHWAEAGLARAKHIGYRFFEPYLLCQRAALRLALGRHADAAEDADAALHMGRSIGGEPALVWARELHARVALARGDAAGARAAAQVGAAHALATGNVMMGSALVPAAALAAAAAGDGARALRWLAALLDCDTTQAPVRAEALALGGVPQRPGSAELMALLRDVAG